VLANRHRDAISKTHEIQGGKRSALSKGRKLRPRGEYSGPQHAKNYFLFDQCTPNAPRSPQLVVTVRHLKFDVRNIIRQIRRQCSGFSFWTLDFRLRELSLRVWKLYFLVFGRSAQRLSSLWDQEGPTWQFLYASRSVCVCANCTNFHRQFFHGLPTRHDWCPERDCQSGPTISIITNMTSAAAVKQCPCKNHGLRLAAF